MRDIVRTLPPVLDEFMPYTKNARCHIAILGFQHRAMLSQFVTFASVRELSVDTSKDRQRTNCTTNET